MTTEQLDEIRKHTDGAAAYLPEGDLPPRRILQEVIANNYALLAHIAAQATLAADIKKTIEAEFSGLLSKHVNRDDLLKAVDDELQKRGINL